MKNLLLVLGLSMTAILSSTASAQMLGIDVFSPVVVKDTRRYLVDVQPNGTDKRAVGGEWLIRNGAVCHEETYGPASTTAKDFKCDQHCNSV
ncbi:hypothetical protein E1N52_37730 [Paraburkholderia guartelaensis]|uniref:Uncharacterized protein n=1 Tax=Paraburkholderia guartelaensis TaxID=2546446 RepID=A0A4R5L2Q0_9BURK|nr:hypothetical protein [Paraburkholderia guartelaensis]TDG02881.1 hypothetical protein E1N52_37730 [Paraburkholderia guartelaensis]